MIRPFISVIIIIASLFTIVFLQMEERRMGYSVLKLSRELKRSHEEKRATAIQIAKMTKPQQVERIALVRNNLKKAQSEQIIHLNGSLVMNQ